MMQTRYTGTFHVVCTYQQEFAYQIMSSEISSTPPPMAHRISVPILRGEKRFSLH
jgi:hypothetical protein